MSDHAVAIFVKTPRLSPVKTRLAATIGAAAAREFFDLSCAAVASVVRQAFASPSHSIEPYWAIADAGNESDWPEFSRISQGDGGLGTKLAHVYASLRQRHNQVSLIGADAPQLNAKHLIAAHEYVTKHGGFCIGPARDGGFYLLTGATDVAPELWESVPYSASNTCEVLKNQLTKQGHQVRLDLLDVLSDVDEVEDLDQVLQELQAQKDLTVAQVQLSQWLQNKAYLNSEG